MVNNKVFSYEKLLITLDILDMIKDEYTTKDMKRKHQLSVYKYLYWKMVSEIRNKSDIVVGGN